MTDHKPTLESIYDAALFGATEAAKMQGEELDPDAFRATWDELHATPVPDHAGDALELLEEVRFTTVSDDPSVSLALAEAGVLASLAIATQIGRVADWLESVQLIDPTAEPEEKRAPAFCEWCSDVARGFALDEDEAVTRASCGRVGHGANFVGGME